MAHQYCCLRKIMPMSWSVWLHHSRVLLLWRGRVPKKIWMPLNSIRMDCCRIPMAWKKQVKVLLNCRMVWMNWKMAQMNLSMRWMWILPICSLLWRRKIIRELVPRQMIRKLIFRQGLCLVSFWLFYLPMWFLSLLYIALKKRVLSLELCMHLG